MIAFSENQRSINELRKAMKVYEAGLNVDMGVSLKVAARSVLSSLAKDTTVAEKYREYQDTGEKSRSGQNRKYLVTTKYATPMRKGKALRRSWQGPWRKQVIYAKNEQELKRRPAVIIAMRGLAAESWRALGKRGKITVKDWSKDTRAAKNKRITKKAARRWVEWRSSLRGPLQYIVVTNHLQYIEHALQGGIAAVTSATERGARAMLHELENKVRKRDSMSWV